MRVKPSTMSPADGCIWVTGASSGIGRALALELARRGWIVAATARGASDLESLALEAQGLPGAIRPFPADVTDRHAMLIAVTSIEAALGPIAVAVFNAGIYLPVDALALDATAFERSFTVNVLGTVYGLEPLLPLMIARGRGQVAIVSSVTGYGGLPTGAAYGATKAALINMAECLHFDLVGAGVKVQVINPGFVKTAATDKNQFPMPFIISAEKAARRIADGLGRDQFEITFPRRFTWMLAAVNRFTTRRSYLGLIMWATGWSKRKTAARSGRASRPETAG